MSIIFWSNLGQPKPSSFFHTKYKEKLTLLVFALSPAYLSIFFLKIEIKLKVEQLPRLKFDQIKNGRVLPAFIGTAPSRQSRRDLSNFRYLCTLSPIFTLSPLSVVRLSARERSWSSDFISWGARRIDLFFSFSEPLIVLGVRLGFHMREKKEKVTFNWSLRSKDGIN